MAADAAVARPETGDAAIARGPENRPPRFRADGERHETRRDGRARATRRAPAPGVEIPRIDAGSGERGMRLAIAHAARQLHHGQLGAEDGARRLELPDDGGVLVEALVLQRRRAPGGRDAARRREQILGAIRNAVERAEVAAGRELPLGAPRLVHRALARERDDGIVAGAERLEPMEERLGELDRRHRARADHFAELAKRDEDRLVAHVVGPERDEGLHRLIGIRELHRAQRAGTGHDSLDALAHVLELRGREASAVALGDHGEEAIDFVRSETGFFHALLPLSGHAPQPRSTSTFITGPPARASSMPFWRSSSGMRRLTRGPTGTAPVDARRMASSQSDRA